jgi:hypothetical protein
MSVKNYVNQNLSAMSREGWELKKSLAYIFVLK